MLLFVPFLVKSEQYSFETAPDDLLRRFSTLGIGPARNVMTMQEIWKLFTEEQKDVVKESSAIHRDTVWKRFTAFFPEDVKFGDLTAERVQAFRDALVQCYAPTTISKTVADLRTFANWSIRKGFAKSNPFLLIARGSTTNRTRDYQVPAAWTERILNACPTQNWRTLYCLWRHAGLRQQEPMGLVRESIDFNARKMVVHATKTERYKNGGDRVVPICPLLARELERQLEEMPDDEHYVVYENRRASFDSGFRRILFNAGLQKWPKTFQNLRSSCENDWVAEGIPAHVVAEWMGHSVKVQEAHYLRVLPEYYERVTGKCAPNF